VTVSRPLAWSLIAITLLGSSLIRQLHEYIPEWGPLPWPVRSPLYVALVLLFLILLATPVPGAARRRVAAGRRVFLFALAPLLVALVYEKVLSITLYEALLDHAMRFSLVRNHLDAWIHIVIGLGMMTAVLLLLPLMGGVRLRDYVSLPRLGSGLLLQIMALVAAYAILATLAPSLGGGTIRPVLLFPAGAAAGTLLIGHVTRAMAEEFYYRGLLQKELGFLGPGLGISDGRNAQAVAVALVALGFGMEHFRFGAPLAESYRGFAYAVAIGCLFGYLLIWTGNVLLCGLVHATNNLATAGLLPRLEAQDGSVLVPPDTLLYVYLILVFLIVFTIQAAMSPGGRRTLLPER
jgi:membrane protease YdiL (CAAX protease family)